MKQLLLIVVAVICIPLINLEAQACQCAEYGTPVCAAFWRSDAVFVGRLESIKFLKRTPDDDFRYVGLHFIVEQPYKGVTSKRVVVGTAAGGICNIPFDTGKRYIIYATLDEKTRQLFTGSCTGTRLATHIEEDLDYLRKVTQQGVQESISGRVVQHQYLGVPGIRVQVVGNDKTFETKTNKSGRFSFALPGPGKFKVRVSVPYEATFLHYQDELVSKQSATDSLSMFEYDLNLLKTECHYLELDIDATDPHDTATVTGNVLTSTGQPVGEGTVYLINVSETGRDYDKSLSKDGSFTFKGVAAGEYYLVLNARNEVPAEYAPDRRTFYPGTEDWREARKIEVGEGATLEKLTLRALPRLKERRVSGIVVWKNGGFIDYPYVAVYLGDRYVRRVELEKNGRFDFKLYGDFDYSIEALDQLDDKKSRSERIKVAQGENAGLRLVLRRVRQ